MELKIYIEGNIFTFNEQYYEKLFGHPRKKKYRIIFSEEDYDYIEDKQMIAILDKEYYKRV